MQIELDSTPFDSFPIEFKEINPEDYLYSFNTSGDRISRSDFIIENGGNKEIIAPDTNGYINDSLQDKITLDHKNTVVINAQVGQGKSYAIIQTVKRFIEDEQRYLVFIASPFVSLVKQYCDDLVKAGINLNDIYSYNRLGRGSGTDYINKTIHVITANTLLGNPGEDGFKNSDIKREYINNLVSKCEREGIKVVFIYDEIHDSFHNFKQEYIFNLWKWRNVIHKNFILSATYNEASKIVIEYLAELTDFKIQIIESERIRYPEKQSSLYLHYSSAYNFTSKTKEINSLIKDLVARGKNIDILSYSRTLAKDLLDPKGEIGNLLIGKFGDLKDCTSELISNQRKENEEPKNQYDDDKCNIGTNFKTGVSIKKDNHAYVIILPPRSTRLTFRNKYGIFSGGINSIIQALARQRNKGEIHIVLPKPDHFDYDSLEHTDMTSTQKKSFEDYYNLVTYYKTPEKMVKYIKLNRQDYFIKSFYNNKLRDNVASEITAVSSRLRSDTLPRLVFPSYQEFKLESGEDYLANDFPIFGEDISAYTTYASLANQFVNCRLKGINFKPVIQFDEGYIQLVLDFVFKNYFGEDYLYSLGEYSNFHLFYQDFKTKLYRDFQLKFKKTDGKRYESIEEGSPIAKKFEAQLLLFVHKLKHFNLTSTDDEDITRSDYFCYNIAHSQGIDVDALNDSEYKNRVRFYQLLDYFRNKMINSLTEYSRGSESFYYIPTKCYDSFFNAEDQDKFRELIILSSSDKLLDNGVFEFKRRFIENKTISSKLRTFYLILKEDFLELENRTNDPKVNFLGSRRNVKPVLSIRIIPSKSNSINLLEPQEYINLD